MNKQEAIAKVQSAAAQEKQDIQDRLARYNTLTRKMEFYQAGQGPAPTTEEFELWKKDVEIHIALKLLFTGPA